MYLHFLEDQHVKTEQYTEEEKDKEEYLFII